MVNLSFSTSLACAKFFLSIKFILFIQKPPRLMLRFFFQSENNCDRDGEPIILGSLTKPSYTLEQGVFSQRSKQIGQDLCQVKLGDM